MISPIDLFRPQPQDGVAQILAGGSNVLVGAINNAVQIGRDSANLRATQEREYLAERERVENLNQRRAEAMTKDLQIDRQFFESVFQSDREFEENVTRDRRDFGFQVEKNAQDTGIRLRELRSVLENREETTDLRREEFELEKEKVSQNKTLLRTRAEDILNKAKPPGLVARIFGAEEPLPEDSITLGKELKEIGVTLRDPTLISRGDALLSKGTKGVIDRRIEIRNTPLPPRPSTRKAAKTPEERIVELTRVIQAYNDLEASPDADDLSNTDRVKKRQAELELVELQKKLAGKSGSKPVEPDKDPLLNSLNPPKPK